MLSQLLTDKRTDIKTTDLVQFENLPTASSECQKAYVFYTYTYTDIFLIYEDDISVCPSFCLIPIEYSIELFYQGDKQCKKMAYDYGKLDNEKAW